MMRLLLILVSVMFLSSKAHADDACYVSAHALIQRVNGVPVREVEVDQLRFAYYDVKDQAECMLRSVETAQKYESQLNGKATIPLLDTAYEVTATLWWQWQFGYFEIGYIWNSFVGESGLVTKATKNNLKGFRPGDQRYRDDGTKWTIP